MNGNTDDDVLCHLENLPKVKLALYHRGFCMRHDLWYLV
jgi:hypothetical protein